MCIQAPIWGTLLHSRKRNSLPGTESQLLKKQHPRRTRSIHIEVRTYDRISVDNPVQTDIVAAGELVLRLCVGEVVNVAVLEVRESELGAAGSLAIPVAVFLCFLATASLEP